MHSKYSYEDSPGPLNSTPLSASRKTPSVDKPLSRGPCYLRKKTRHGLMAFFVAVLIFALLAWYYVTQHGRMSFVAIGPMSFDPQGRVVILSDAEGQTVFRDKVGMNLPEGAELQDCTKEADSLNSLCLTWINVTLQDESPLAEMDIEYVVLKNNIKCINVDWTALRLNFAPLDCISLNDSHWYGGSIVHSQHWVLEKLRISMQPYVSGDIVSERNAFGSVLERYWLSSRGVAVFVERDTPLHVSINEKQTNRELCFKAEYFNSPYQNPTNKHASLKYTVCMGEDVRKVHEYILQNYFSRPPGLPDERMFRWPIWSTGARYHVNINQSAVIEYADEINHHGFPNSHIEIDDKYTLHYGDVDFTQTKFPNAREMIEDLHDKGFRVSAWTHPFANIDSPTFRKGISHNYWMREPSGRVPALIKWWNGIGAILDVSDEGAANWYIGLLRKMQTDYGLDSFRFDAGEVSYIPFIYNATVPFNDPNLYCTQYVELVSTINQQINVRCGHQTQHQPVFVRMVDRDANWNYNNGLLTVIPTALLMGILGYPFILPGYVSTNVYSVDVNHPNRELYIRWVELMAYLPSMQFSVAPWQYDEEVIRIAHKMVKIHEDVVTPMIFNFSSEVITKGYPVIRPIWWIAPTDKVAQHIDSQFLIGSAYLVAPVLTQHARARDIYLPAGNWKEELGKQTILAGGMWLKDYPVGIDEVATFVKV
ncbi:uncharacterized family 31 glucosidase KIAA1161-like [Acanthaster planci]|uniref:Uncharacterized family 31 glucosidase KIAA1161-like n=1 Tax=Acanthaster planci TaxID=133434 RepID=A0A8B7ZPZ6_ACAPL|nr:uncharacterized family 31 glucosidase KIAA1161-like [Acanthaster planci]XP_022107125.1 uncharacterized family 31 glucosidase KIAA1161-like [Acanthaster planci]XP_022107132.1 uncharacterized family 31 glucosidase KIAA1161-like [Acanthaster planci]XP_022107141.1 uncharacterized family 31 glucosidase KIAA1161-like [Acanthaster planci]XP_022107151.1 uncharacterized family 31 glucosidase KIAA1161-like [Acanthaster planci]